MSLPLRQTIPNELLTLRDWVRWASSEFRRAELFFGHGTDNDWDEALVLALWAIDQPWSRLELIWDTKLVDSEKNRFHKAVTQRIQQRCPAAYITGEAWFAGERYIVNEHVLVPRSPIAEMIDHQFQPWLTDYPETILDLCTGSGCIGIACALEFSDAHVDLIDISNEALEVANKNIALHGLNDRVRALASDGLSALDDERYDLIVSNPPYVSEDEYASLPEEFKIEPKLGLTSGADGFDFVRTLLKNASSFLNEQGLLVVEVGHGWEQLMHAIPEYPFLWPEFENGGCGVFVLTKSQLDEVNNPLNH